MVFFLYLSSILISSFRYFQVASFFILVDIRKVKSYIFHPLLFIFCLTYISTSFQIYHSPPPATLCEGGANFRHFHRLKALSMNCIMDKFQYGGLRFRILHCLMNFLHFLPKRFCSNPVADFRVPRKIKYISVSFEL